MEESETTTDNTQNLLKEAQMVLGRQIAIEYYNCRRDILDSASAMEQVFMKAAQESGATIISSHFHQFLPQGVSGVVIISESHFAQSCLACLIKAQHTARLHRNLVQSRPVCRPQIATTVNVDGIGTGTHR